jgi:hypothetical protein
VGGGHLAGGVGGGQVRKLFEAAAGADEGGGVTAGDPAVPREPGLGGGHAVGAGSVAAVGGGDQTGLQRAELVERRLQHRNAVEQLVIGQVERIAAGQVEGGEPVEHRSHFRHDRSPTLRLEHVSEG